MLKCFTGFTAYDDVSNNNLGLVEVYSNMDDLMVNSVIQKGSYTAEITFLENNGIKYDNPFRLTLRKNEETWKLTGQGLSFSDNKVKISLTLVAYYKDDDEYLYWDNYKYIHRIQGNDIMRQTRINLGME